MSATNTFETQLLELIFENDDTGSHISTIGDGLQASATAGTLEISLHTGDPGETGDATTSEANYTSYARQTVARSAAGWATSGNTVDNVAAITFPEATGGSSTCTHFGIGTGTSDRLLVSGALTSSLAVTSGVQPQFAIGDCNVTLD